MGDLRALIERVEKLGGPDREVDGEIFYAVAGSEWEEAYRRAQEPCGCPHDMAVEVAKSRYAPRFTASLDAAIALCERVLPGCYREMTGPRKYLNIPTPVPARFRAVVNNATGWHDQEPIALVLAALRALEAQGGGKK